MTIEKIKVLFLASNPIGTSTLSLDKELRLITRKIRSSEYRDAIDLIPCLATQADDFIDFLNQHRPDILHFSGHGSPDGEILLMDQDGSPMPVSPPCPQAASGSLQGYNLLLDDPFTWEEIPTDREWLIMTLSRNDQTVLDRYVIPLGASDSPGLIPVTER
jgi:hypothetical protein